MTAFCELLDHRLNLAETTSDRVGEDQPSPRFLTAGLRYPEGNGKGSVVGTLITTKSTLIHVHMFPFCTVNKPNGI